MHTLSHDSFRIHIKVLFDFFSSNDSLLTNVFKKIFFVWFFPEIIYVLHVFPYYYYYSILPVVCKQQTMNEWIIVSYDLFFMWFSPEWFIFTWIIFSNVSFTPWYSLSHFPCFYYYYCINFRLLFCIYLHVALFHLIIYVSMVISPSKKWSFFTDLNDTFHTCFWTCVYFFPIKKVCGSLTSDKDQHQGNHFFFSSSPAVTLLMQLPHLLEWSIRFELAPGSKNWHRPWALNREPVPRFTGSHHVY